jgi:hypothetical protein
MWTFAFAANPIVVFASSMPSSSYSSGIWITGLNTTAVWIYNNSVTMNLEVIARASV